VRRGFDKLRSRIRVANPIKLIGRQRKRKIRRKRRRKNINVIKVIYCKIFNSLILLMSAGTRFQYSLRY